MKSSPPTPAMVWARSRVVPNTPTLKTPIALEYDWESASARALANNRPEWAQALSSGYVK